MLRRNRWPASTDRGTYERNQEPMAANRTRHSGVPRGGPALPGGLVRCGRCGRRMAVADKDDGRETRYACRQLATTFGGPRCRSIGARPVDEPVAGLMLEALRPSAIEVGLQLAEDLELERAELHRQWVQRLERARYETALARRRYEAVEPANRLVARTLDHDREAAPAAEQALHAEHERDLARQPTRLSEAERDAIRRSAEDVPALWRARSTTATDRQAIARLMLERVVIQVLGDSEPAEIGRHHLVRQVRRFEQLRGFDRLLARIAELRRQGCTAAAIADRLNAEGWRPPKRAAFDAPMIRRLRQRHGLGSTRPIWSGHVPREAEDEVTLQELADQTGAHRQTV